MICAVLNLNLFVTVSLDHKIECFTVMCLPKLYIIIYYQVVRVTANDSDSGAHGRVSYSIISQPLPEKFIIDRDGQIYTKSLLDRENNDNYDVNDQYMVGVTPISEIT